MVRSARQKTHGSHGHRQKIFHYTNLKFAYVFKQNFLYPMKLEFI